MAPDWHTPDSLSFLSPDEIRTRLLEAQEFSARVSILSELSLKIDGARSREEIIRTLRESVKHLIDGECAFLSLLSQNKTHYVISTLSPLMDAIELDHKHFSVEIGMPGWAIQNGASIVVDIESAPSFHQPLEGKLKDLGISSLVIVPLRASDDILGAMLFGSSKPNAYIDADLWLAQLLALQVAIALRHTTLLERAQKRAVQIELVNLVASKLRSYY